MHRFKFRSATPWRLALLCALALPVSERAAAARHVQDGLVYDGVPAISAEVGAGLARYRGVQQARLLDWTSDGALLIAAEGAGQDQLQRVASTPVAIGAPAAALRAAAAQPYSNEVIALLQSGPAAPAAATATAGAAAAAGAETPGAGAALYLEAAAGGELRPLVGAAARPGAPVWAHDGHRLAFSAALRDGHSIDLYVLDTADTAGPRLIAAGSANDWQVLAWTRGDRALLVRHAVSDAGDELLLVDVVSGALRRVDAPAEKSPGYGHIGEVRLVGEGAGVYFLSDRDSGAPQLRYVDLADDGSPALAPVPGRDLEHFDVSADGRYLAYSWNAQGYSRVALLDRHGGVERPLPGLPTGVVAALRFDRSGARLALEIAASTAPREVYVYELASGAVTRATHSDLGALGATGLVAPQTVRFPTWDRQNGQPRALGALLYRPRQPGPRPVLVLLHEGAAPQRPQLDLFAQYCVNELGYAVVAPELRSGEPGALDLGALLAWIGVQPDLQRDRVLLLGRGGGGTLALTGLGLYGDRVRAAVSIDGTAGSAHLAPIRQPVLLVRGLLSPPLDAGSAEQVLWRLHSANVETWFVAPAEAQGSLDGARADQAQQVIAQFLQRQLAAPAAPKTQ